MLFIEGEKRYTTRTRQRHHSLTTSHHDGILSLSVSFLFHILLLSLLHFLSHRLMFRWKAIFSSSSLLENIAAYP